MINQDSLSSDEHPDFFGSEEYTSLRPFLSGYLASLQLLHHIGGDAPRPPYKIYRQVYYGRERQNS